MEHVASRLATRPPFARRPAALPWTLLVAQLLAALAALAPAPAQSHTPIHEEAQALHQPLHQSRHQAPLPMAPLPQAFDPAAGQWMKASPDELRVMTWNVQDGLCSTASKVEGLNSWTALARIVAALRPDVLLLQEVGDNTGNGTGMGVDSVPTLALVLDLFVHGGVDPFVPGAPRVSGHVQSHAPDYDLPFAFVGSKTDGFNRNAVLSRFPFADLNGDGQSQLSDLPLLQAHLYAPGGTGGLRGYQVVEVDLPDALWAGDLVVGNCHLRSGSSAADHAERIAAAQNIAYYLDHIFNGGGLGVPDPFGTVSDAPPVTQLLPPQTLVLTGGDWNEDEAKNGAVKGPAEWITRAAVSDAEAAAGATPDGTDRDRSDMHHDAASDPFTGGTATTLSSKLDYLAWQDSVGLLQRAFLFEAASLPGGVSGAAMPPELLGFPGDPALASAFASDHRPVIADIALPPASRAGGVVDAGPGTPGGSGLVPRFTVCGALGSGQVAEFRLEDAAPYATAWLLFSLAAEALPVFGGTLVPAAPLLAPPLRTDNSGALSLAVPGGGGPAGLFVQWAVVDPGAAYGKCLSNALQVEFGP